MTRFGGTFPGVLSWFRRGGLIRLVLVAIFATGLVVGGGLIALAAHVPNGHLAAVGPTDPANGFPVWYQDKGFSYVDAGGATVAVPPVSLALCLNPNDPLCGFAPPFDFDPAQPVLFPGNFPGESFYQLATASVGTNGGRAIAVLDLEATFNSGVPTPGDNITFGRVRVVADLPTTLPVGATYKVTHPYGVETFSPTAGGKRAIFFTEDVGIGAPGDFAGALNSRIGPFLRWDPAVLPAAPAGYLGDPNYVDPATGVTGHAVIGSPYNPPTNFFRIEGPGIGIGSLDRCPINGDNCVETRLFSVAAKISTIAGVDVARATYTRGAAGSYIDVFAGSKPLQDLHVESPTLAFPPTEMLGDGNGHYASRVAFNGVVPTSVTVNNLTDLPPSSKTIPVVDLVTITQAVATYNQLANTFTMTVTASSSDQAVPPTLTAAGFGPLTPGAPVTFPASPFAPPSITVLSAAGGSDTEAVVLAGDVFLPCPVVAIPGPNRTVNQGDLVTLDGSGSTPVGSITSYRWVQTAGTPVVLTNPTTAVATFPAPALAGDLVFALTVADASGATNAASVTISVRATALVPSVTLVASPSPAAQGALVTLSGTVANASSVSWTQTAGPVVALTTGGTLTAPTASFTFPNQNVSLSFRLSATGSGGTASAIVTVSVATDTLAVTRAEYRITGSIWRIDGTASVLANNTVTIYLGTSTGPVIGTAQVGPLGNWTFRQLLSQVRPSVPAGSTTTITIVSSKGGSLTTQATVRR